MNKNEKKNWLEVFIPLIFVGIVVALIGVHMVNLGEKNHAMASIEDNQELQTIHERAEKREKELDPNSGSGELYNAVLFDWKSLGDVTGQSYFYKRALKVARKAEKAGLAKSSLFATNTANIHKALGEFDDAQAYYELAIGLAPGDASIWEAYLDLHINWKKSSTQEIVTIFDRALSTLINKTTVTQMKGAYLQSLGRYDEAMAIYSSLQVAYPDNDQFKQKIAEIKLQMDQ